MRFVKDPQSFFAFIDRPEIPPTNNDAERTLRGSVIDRKISLATQSRIGLLFCEVIWTVAETAKLQERELQDCLTGALTAAREGRLLPSLVNPGRTVPKRFHDQADDEHRKLMKEVKAERERARAGYVKPFEGGSRGAGEGDDGQAGKAGPGEPRPEGQDGKAGKAGFGEPRLKSQARKAVKTKPEEPRPESPAGKAKPGEPRPEGQAGKAGPEEPQPEGQAGKAGPEEPQPKGQAGKAGSGEPQPEGQSGKAGKAKPGKPHPESPPGKAGTGEPQPESQAGKAGPGEPRTEDHTSEREAVHSLTDADYG
jgi:hypothetical protein